jgi:cytochrome bd-type quinol oxidase subunit 2
MTNDVMMIIAAIAAPFIIFAIVLAYVDFWSNQTPKQE